MSNNPGFVSDPRFNFGGFAPSIGASALPLHDQTGVQTPTWMVAAYMGGTAERGGESYFHSSVQDWEDYGQLDAFWTKSECNTYGHVIGELFSSSAMKQSVVVIRVPFESYIPKFKVAMNDKRNFSEIIISMLIHAGGAMLQQKIDYSYKNCKIQTFEQSMDGTRGIYHVDIGFRADAETITAYRYSQTGEADEQGQIQSVTDYTLNTSMEGQ